MSAYRDELVKAMTMLGERPDTLFIGQSVAYPGHIMTSTLEAVPREKIMELPVAEEMQMGVSVGLALEGYLPISIFPRMDFLMLAMNQLINHLDKWAEMSHGQLNPKVIIRTMVGSIIPMHPGPQHMQDHTKALKLMLTNVDVIKLTRADEIMPAYNFAMRNHRSTILVEAPLRREGYE